MRLDFAHVIISFSFFIFHLVFTFTHTHTHIYIYIYIFIYTEGVGRVRHIKTNALWPQQKMVQRCQSQTMDDRTFDAGSTPRED